MATFNIQIAGKTAAVTSLFESTRDYCARYLTEDAPDFSVTVTQEHLDFEQNALLEEALQEGLRPRTFTGPFLDRAAIQRQVAEALLDADTLMIHGSLIAVDGRGYLFTAAKCGTGKSTHTRFWRELFGSRAVMINDDKPFLRMTEAGVLACGAPWSGKHGLDTNMTVPLAGICLVERGTENRIRSGTPEELLPMIRKESFCPGEESKQAKFLRLTEMLAKKVPLWRMECIKDISAARMSYAAMSGETK